MSIKINVPVQENKGLPKLAAELYDAYMMPDEGLVIVGFPLLDEDEVHDCDAAGCSSVSHVVYRYGKPQVEVIKEAAHE